MPRIIKVNNMNVLCFTPKEIDRMTNVYLGKNCRIRTNEILRKDPVLNKFINNETMGVLDNYAKHKDMNISITPYENDLLNDIAVTIYKNKDNLEKSFAMNLPKDSKAISTFLRELYNNILKETNAPTAPAFIKPIKKAERKNVKSYFDNLINKFREMRAEKIKNFIEKHRNEKSIKGLLADTMEEINYSEFS